MTLLDIVRLLRRRWMTLLLGGLIGLALAAAYSFVQPVEYTASASGYIVSGSSTRTINTDPTKAQGIADSYLPLANTKAVRQRIQNHLKNDPSGAREGSIRASMLPGTNVVLITAGGDTPQKAQAVANAGLRAFAEEVNRLESLNPAAASVGPDGKLEDIPTTARPRIALVGFEPAELPRNPSSPNWLRNLAAGLVAGLALALVWIYLRKALDARARVGDEVEQLADASVLGVIPQSPELGKQRKKGKDVAAMGVAGEALRSLRTNLRFVKVDSPPKAIVVTSANPGEGKSTVAANLARVLAESGQQTVIVDADLRRPMQATAFARDGKVGLTQLLAGQVRLADALQETDTANLKLLPAGRIPPNPSELLGSRHMSELLKTLGQRYTVIIDAPPVLPVTDAGLLTASSDGALLVVRVGKTYKDQVSLAAKIIRKAGGDLLGTVMNGASKRELGEVMYGHGGYGSTSYAYQETEQPKRRGKRVREEPLDDDTRTHPVVTDEDPIRPSRSLPEF